MPKTSCEVSGARSACQSGRARSAMVSTTGAIVSSESAAASAMTTVFEGTPWAPMALRTICSVVDAFTNEVVTIKRKGKSETSASATTSASGRDNKSSAPPPAALPRAGGGAASANAGQATNAAETAAEIAALPFTTPPLLLADPPAPRGASPPRGLAPAPRQSRPGPATAGPEATPRARTRSA